MRGGIRMAISVNSIKCPDCGADLEYEEGREKIFCTYCGVPIVITNENEKIIRHIDEAAIKREETERIIKLKEHEAKEKRNDRSYKMRMIKIKATIVIAIVSGITFFVGMISDEFSNLWLFGFWGFAILAWMWLTELTGLKK